MYIIEKEKGKKKILLSCILIFLMFFGVYSYAQTGPGGVGTKGAAGTNVLWLRSGDLTGLVNGNDITTWADVSGRGNDVSQPNALFKPVYNTTTPLNGYPLVNFSKANSRIRKTSFSNFPTTQITAIYVNKTSDNSEGVLSYAPSAARSNEFLLFSSNNLRVYRNNVNLSSGISFNDNAWHITNASWQSSGGNVQLWKDGASVFTSTLASGTSMLANGTLAIAGEQDSVDGGYDAAQAHQGDFTEVIIFNTALNDAQQIIVSNYLGAKYGISISNDHYAYQATHYFDVAGIGRENLTNTHLAAMSDDILQIENATAIADGDYLLFGHDNGDVATAWTTTEAPNSGVNIQRLAREWRLDDTGTVGDVDFVVDVASFPALPAGHTMYALMVDNDGDFSTGAETYEMTLVSGTRYSVTGVGFNDGDYVSIAAVNPKIQHTVTSGSGLETVNAVIEISLNFIPQTNKTVQFTTADGTATAGSDYTAAVATVATILAGNTTATYTITVTDDAVVESTETLTSTLSSPSVGLTLGSNTVFTYSINDNDAARKVSFDVATANGNENISPVTVNLSLDVADAFFATTIDYSVTGGTATGSGTDYTLASGTVTFPATITSGSFDFTVNDDVLYESNETIIITLSAPVNCNLSDVDPIEYTYTINDNDANPTLQFTNTSSTGVESVSPVNFAVELDVVSGIDASATFTVTGTAIGGGTDYLLADGTITIPAGSTTANITAIINDDAEVELNETLIITLTLPVDATLGANTVYTYTITDNDTFGYTGPGGVGDNGSNILWLDGDKITSLADNDNLLAWSDVSGNSNDFSQNATFSPIYKTSIVNGNPVARFNKANNRIRRNGFTDFASTALTAIFVNRSTDSGDGLLGYGSTTVPDNEFLLYDSNNLQLFINNTSVSTGVDINDNNWHIVNTSWQSSGGNYEIWKDGTEVNTGTVSAGVVINTGGTLALAGEQDALDGGYTTPQAHQGDFPEVIMYNVYLNTAQQIIVSNYLSAKYNISISNDFYTQDNPVNGNFDFNVAGIGQASDNSFHADSQGNGIVRMYAPSSLATDDYLFWGRNNNTAYTFTTNTNNYKERITSEWRVSKVNNLGSVTFEVDLTGIDISEKPSCANLKLVIDNNSNLLTPTTSYDLTNVSGNIYQATGVTFVDGDYFTLEYQDKIVVDNVQFYNGSGAGNAPDTSDDCYKLLVKNTATGAVNLTANADVREVEVEAGGVLSISTGNRLLVENGISNSGEIRLVGTSQLLQNHALVSQVTGTGKLFRDQAAVTTTVFQSGYWSSPVTTDGSNFTIDDVLKDGTVPTTATVTGGEALDINFIAGHDGNNATSPIQVSTRWLAKLTNDVDWTRYVDPDVTSFSPTEGWNMKSVGANYTFEGIPNDGNYTTSIDQDRLSLIGNPYPSAIDADQFISDNSDDFNGVLYFYNSASDNTHVKSDYTGTYHTRVNGVGTPVGTTAIAGANYYIPIGQAFFVTRDAAGTGTITFQNSQRVFETIGGESVFFGKGNSKKSSEKSNSLALLRLGFSFDVNENQNYKRELAIAFRGLTNNYEKGFDAEMLDRQPSDLALKVLDNDAPYVIAGVDYLDEDMEIPLELYLDADRNVTFSLDALENLSATVYVKDAFNFNHYNISEGNVTLPLTTGDYSDRFSIVFVNREVLAVEDNLFLADIDVYHNSDAKEIVINRKNDLEIYSSELYNVLGQKVMSSKYTSTYLDNYAIKTAALSSSIYILKLKTSKGIYTKKILL